MSKPDYAQVGVFAVQWIDHERSVAYPPDPSWPHGSAVDVALDAARACQVTLRSPAERCGLWQVKCRSCGYEIALSTTGRADDPASVRVPCRVQA